MASNTPPVRDDVMSYFRQLRGMANGGAISGGVTNSNPNPAGVIASVAHGQVVRPAVAAAAHTSTTSNNLSPVQASNYRAMLPPPLPHHEGRHLMVLDLDETLVHSSFQPVASCDLSLPVVVDGKTYQVFVKVRPHAAAFLEECAKLFETIIFTASLSAYADGLMDVLDPGKVMCPYRLFREHCSFTNGAYVKDLSLLGRDLHRIVIADNSPVAYLFQPRNAIPVVSWFDDPRDNELRDMIPWLHRLAGVSDVYPVLDELHQHLASGLPKK